MEDPSRYILDRTYGLTLPFLQDSYTLTPFDRMMGKIKRAESLRTNDEGSGLRESPVGEEGHN